MDLHVIKNFPALFGSEGPTTCTNFQALAPLVNQMKPINNLPRHFFKIHFNIILPSTKLSATFSFPYKKTPSMTHSSPSPFHQFGQPENTSLVRSKNHEDLHCAFFCSLLSLLLGFKCLSTLF
jgi:hypothetical protein